VQPERKKYIEVRDAGIVLEYQNWIFEDA